jgi:DNA-binding CsgD family transcriptional regulator
MAAVSDPIRGLTRSEVTMEALAEALRGVESTAEMGRVLSDAAGRRIGHSAFCFMRVSGPVISPSDFFATNAREPSGRTCARLAEILPVIDRELMPFAKAYGSRQKSHDIAQWFPQDVVRRSEVYNTFWRPFSIERQLVGFLGSPGAPRGFLCVARAAREPAFRLTDLEALEAMRSVVERELGAPSHGGATCLEDALAVLAQAETEPWFLFDSSGALLWLTDGARARLSADAVRFGVSVAVRHGEALEQLRGWVVAEARRREVTPPGRRPAPSLPARRGPLTMRRFETIAGRVLFLVGFADPVPDAAASPGAARVSRFARTHRLTPRQADVLARLSMGAANKDIAAALACSVKAVEQHVTALLRRFRVASRAELIARFWSAGDR